MAFKQMTPSLRGQGARDYVTIQAYKGKKYKDKSQFITSLAISGPIAEKFGWKADESVTIHLGHGRDAGKLELKTNNGNTGMGFKLRRRSKKSGVLLINIARSSSRPITN